MENQKNNFTSQLQKIEPTNAEDIFHLGVKTIIKNSEDQILILKRKKGSKQYWDLPGGRVQIGEEIETAALREIAEETGITNLKNMYQVGMSTSTIRIPISQEHTVGLIFSFYTGTVENCNVTLSSEHQQYNWVTPQKAIELLDPTHEKIFVDIFG